MLKDCISVPSMGNKIVTYDRFSQSFQIDPQWWYWGTRVPVFFLGDLVGSRLATLFTGRSGSLFYDSVILAIASRIYTEYRSINSDLRYPFLFGATLGFLWDASFQSKTLTYVVPVGATEFDSDEENDVCPGPCPAQSRDRVDQRTTSV